MEKVKTQEMTEQEIKEGLKLFKMVFKRGLATYEHANPLEENCYISSCGDLIGVYFPNSVIKFNKHKNYDFVCISKVNNKLCLVFSLKYEIAEKQRTNPPKNIYFVLDNYQVDTIESLVYSYEYLKIKDKLEKQKKEYQSVLNALNNIKLITRKNGEKFKKVLDNFELLTTYGKANIYFDYCFCSPIVNSVKIGNLLTMYRNDEDKKKNITPTVEEVQELINKYKGYYLDYINREQTELKNLFNNYCKLEKLAEKVKEFKKSVVSWYNFDDTFIEMVRYGE